MLKNVIIFIVVILTLVLIFLPIYLRKKVWADLIKNLDSKNYNKYYEILDSKKCAYAYPAFNREYMRLSGYLAEGKDDKIEAQINELKNLQLSPKQKASVASRAFYYYLEKENKVQAKRMLEFGKGVIDDATYQNMVIQNSILLKKESKYINECQKMLDSLWDGKSEIDEKDKYAVGTLQYMIGLQYAYKNNQDKMIDYFNKALENLKGTLYEDKIKKIVKDK